MYEYEETYQDDEILEDGLFEDDDVWSWANEGGEELTF
jgi:hypothetical protein